MRKSRFTEEQIIKVLQEGDAGAKVEELCRSHGCIRPDHVQLIPNPPLIIGELRRTENGPARRCCTRVADDDAPFAELGAE